MELLKKAPVARSQNDNHWLPENIIEINQCQLLTIAEKIFTDEKCRFPQLTIRILIHFLAGIDFDGEKVLIARKLAKTLNVNYDTVTKCVKYLREIGVLRKER